MFIIKPAIVLSTLLFTQPAVGMTNATIGGIIAGEVVCSLSRQGHSAKVLAAELGRITDKLKAKGLLKATDEEEYLEAARTVFQECP